MLNKIFKGNKFNNYDEMNQSLLLFHHKLKTTSANSLDIITYEFIDFYNEYQPRLQKMINNSNTQEDTIKYYNHYIRLNILYNNYYNYSFNMMTEFYFKAYKCQTDFLKNKLFIKNLFDYSSKQAANQVLVSTMLKLLISILCFKNIQNIADQSIEFDYKECFKQLDNQMKIDKNRKNRKTYFLIKSFDSFIKEEIELSRLYLGYIFNLEKDKYNGKLYSIPLQYTGMGENAYITAPLPDDYKSFINKNILDINLSNLELNDLYEKITINDDKPVIAKSTVFS